MLKVTVGFDRHPTIYNGVYKDIVIPLHLDGYIGSGETVYFYVKNNPDDYQYYPTFFSRVSPNSQQFLVYVPNFQYIRNLGNGYYEVDLYIQREGTPLPITNISGVLYYSFENGFNTEFTRTGSGTYFDNQDTPSPNNLDAHIGNKPYAIAGWGNDTAISNHFNPIYSRKGMYKNISISFQGAGVTEPTVQIMIFARSTYSPGSDAAGHQQFYIQTTTSYTTQNVFGVGNRSRNAGATDRLSYFRENSSDKTKIVTYDVQDFTPDGLKDYRFMGFYITNPSGGNSMRTRTIYLENNSTVRTLNDVTITAQSNSIQTLGVQGQHERCSFLFINWTCGDFNYATSITNLQFYSIVKFPTTPYQYVNVKVQKPIVRVIAPGTGKQKTIEGNTMFIRSDATDNMSSVVAIQYSQGLQQNDPNNANPQYLFRNQTSWAITEYRARNVVPVSQTDKVYHSGSFYRLSASGSQATQNIIGFTQHKPTDSFSTTSMYIIPIQMRQLRTTTIQSNQTGTFGVTLNGNVQQLVTTFNIGGTNYLQHTTHIDHYDNVNKWNDVASIQQHTDSLGHIDYQHVDQAPTTTYSNHTVMVEQHTDSTVTQSHSDWPHGDWYYSDHSNHTDWGDWPHTDWRDIGQYENIQAHADSTHYDWPDYAYHDDAPHSDVQEYYDHIDYGPINQHSDQSTYFPHGDIPATQHSDQAYAQSTPHIDYNYTDQHGDIGTPLNTLGSIYFVESDSSRPDKCMNIRKSGTAFSASSFYGRAYYIDWS